MKIIKLVFILVIASLLLSCEKVPQQPNVVFVFADQLRSHELSCYGGQNIQTPNMDRLAGEGLRLNNAISTCPICSPFRGMLMTGSYPMRTGVTNNDHPMRADVPSIAEAFNAAGYQTAYIGKWHLDGRGRSTYIPEERRFGYQFWQALECTHRYFKSDYYDNNNSKIKQWPGYDADAQTQSAIKYIRQRDKEKPFFIMLSWGPPHGPYIAPDEFMERVDPASLSLRPNVSESEVAQELIDHPRFNIPDILPKGYKEKMLKTMREDSLIRKDYAGYLAATLAVDQYLGDLLDALKAEGLDENTIVVFTADHGDQMASHRFFDKNMPYEESLSVPFLLRYPPKIKSGISTDVMLEPVDIMPTLLSLAGVKSPKVDGADKSAMLLGKTKDTTDAVLLMGMTHFNNTSLVNGLDTWRGVRTKRYTYARYEDGTPWLLFDNVADPYQMDNLVDDPDFIRLVVKLNSTVDQLLQKAGDPEDTRAIYDVIIKENPKRRLLLQMREANPGRF